MGNLCSNRQGSSLGKGGYTAVLSLHAHKKKHLSYCLCSGQVEIQALASAMKFYNNVFRIKRLTVQHAPCTLDQEESNCGWLSALGLKVGNTALPQRRLERLTCIGAKRHVMELQQKLLFWLQNGLLSKFMIDGLVWKNLQRFVQLEQRPFVQIRR